MANETEGSAILVFDPVAISGGGGKADRKGKRRASEQARVPETPRPSTDQPLEDYYPKAKAWADHEYSKARDEEGWRSSTWDLARALKAHPDLSGASAEDVYKRIDWEALNLSVDEREQFVSEWPLVDVIPGDSWVNYAKAMAELYPVRVEPGMGAPTPLYSEFLSLVAWLQLSQGVDGTVFLPCRKIGEELGCDKKTVSRMRKRAAEIGLLDEIESHTTTRATRFRFNLTRFPWLLARAKNSDLQEDAHQPIERELHPHDPRQDGYKSAIGERFSSFYGHHVASREWRPQEQLEAEYLAGKLGGDDRAEVAQDGKVSSGTDYTDDKD